MGVTDPIPEPYLSVITKRLPGLPPGLDPLVTAASREKLANDLEAAINRESSITIERIPKPRPKPDDVAFAATNSEAAPSQDVSAGSAQAIATVNKTHRINYLWLVITFSGIVAVYMFVNKWKS
jgi:xanthine dehydrogenase iron-sulfur cluster and FAD-binding subunit A